jgi:hypothetical protein
VLVSVGGHVVARPKAQEVEKEVVGGDSSGHRVQRDYARVGLVGAIRLRLPLLVGLTFDRELACVDEPIAPKTTVPRPDLADGGHRVSK